MSRGAWGVSGWGGVEEVLSSNTRLCCFWLWDKQCWQVVRSGIRAQGNGRESPAVGGGRSVEWMSSGIGILPTVSKCGGEAWKTLTLCQSVKRFFFSSTFFLLHI